jgi:hypothetical protein
MIETEFNLKKIVQQKKNYLKVVAKQIIDSSLANCYLIYGPKGVGKEKIVLNLIKAIRCEQKERDKSLPCYQCQSCLAVENGLAQDLIIVEPEKDTIKIDQIRRIKESANYKSFNSRRLVWIKSANQLTDEAANSILKILEEDNNTVFFLSADELSFPKTIISRSQPVYIPPRIDKAKLNDTNNINRALATAGLPYLSQIFDKDFLNKVHQLFINLNQGGLSDRLNLVSDKLLKFNLKDLILLLIIFERDKGLASKSVQDNIKLLIESSKSVSKASLNKKIFYKHIFLNYRKD